MGQLNDWRSLPRKPRPDLAERNKKSAVHGMNGSPTWKSWSAMKDRITNPACKDYPSYGGRGLDMDPRWLSFESFLSDMGVRPARLSIGRIDNEKGYWPANCRWESQAQQDRNKRTNRYLEWQGKRITLSEAAEIVGCSRQAIGYRVRAGWTADQIMSAADRRARRK